MGGKTRTVKQCIEAILDDTRLKQRDVVERIRDLHSSSTRRPRRRGGSGSRHRSSPDFSFFQVYSSAVHLLAQRDDLKLCEQLLKPIPETTLCQIVNTPIGKAGYTPLTRAVFLGSERMIKFLTSAGGDLKYINSHGETMLDALMEGEAQAVERDPSNAIFTRERFRQCRMYIKSVTAEPITPSKVRTRVPRRIRAARVISACC